MRRLPYTIYHLSFSVALLAAVLLSACASDDSTKTEEPLPDGMGRIQTTITTRSVLEDPNKDPVHENPWETPDHDWEVMHSLRVIICKASDNTVVQIIEVADQDINHSVPATPPTAAHNQNDYYYSSDVTVTSDPLPVGDYHVFATANYDDGYQVGERINLDRTEKFPFGLSMENDDYTGVEPKDIPFGVQRNIPMTGKLTDNGALKSVHVSNRAETDAGVLTVWRVIGKMQFEFTNESDKDIRIVGIEVEPVNLASEGPGIYLFSHDDLTLTDNLEAGENHETGKYGVSLPPKGNNAKSARDDVGTVKYQPATIPLTLAAKGGENNKGTIYFYLNESDATFTTTQNQLSLRFKVQRKKDDNTWYDEEIRYGVTTHHDLTNNDPYGGYKGGFNVIRRNDWIHIPVVLTDWQLRIEPLAFVPIAGYPAKTLSSDGLTATFSTGGMIALQPFIKKYSDSTWRGFGDPEITYGEVVMDSEDNTKVNDEDSWEASIRWKNADGDTKSGDDLIVKTPFAYDPVTKCIIGELNQDKVGDNYMTTFTVCLRLGPAEAQYVYTFTFNVVLK